MAVEMAAAPVLSTPDDHLFEYEKPDTTSLGARSDHDLREIYEVQRTVAEIRQEGRKRIALQFPDHMLGDAPRVVELLKTDLAGAQQAEEPEAQQQQQQQKERIWILADTSYSACCVDEIAAEHVDADVLVHYGRSCLSPTSRIPVIYVFTKHDLVVDGALSSFEGEFPDKDAKVVLMADVTYQAHVPELYRRIKGKGYTNLLSTRIQHNPLGSIPNRTVTDGEGAEVKVGEQEQDGGIDLKTYSVFHISSPPAALLLALSSRIASLHVYPMSESSDTYYSPTRTTRAMLGRRYAKLLHLTTAGIIGILVNTLSVANYLASIESIRKQIAAAGKKSYTIVVGKLNPAKLANFAEIDGWVVIGCWESSLVEEDARFYRPVLTPFELEVALMPDEERVWGLSWWGGIESVKPVDGETSQEDTAVRTEAEEDDSDAPVFDLRTGKLVFNARPMRQAAQAIREEAEAAARAPGKRSGALAVRPKAELATINGVLSPGAEFLRSQRTWQGLGSDFDDQTSATIEEGRSGVARGYTVGEEDQKT